jgi:flagellar hook-basal body complex protein FliE
MKDMGIEQLAGNAVNQFKALSDQKTVNGRKDFENILGDSIKQANNLQLNANRAIEELATGKNANVHETMIAIEKATVSFQMMMQVRNKIIDAYKEIIKTSM